jgi:DNA-binding transcriptional LysR family regulator
MCVDARRLAILRTVVETGSVVAAAQKLGYTSSAISQSIAALQREVDISLFDRVGRGLRPTQAALVLAGVSARVEAQLSAAEDALDALRAGRAGCVRLAAFATAGTALVPRALALFRSGFPEIDIKYSMAEADDALQAVRSAEVDVAVVALPGAPTRKDTLVWRHLLDDSYLLVLPTNHSAARFGQVRLADLSREPWVTTASARCNCEETVVRACAGAGFVPTFAVEADEFATTLGFVAAGLGVAMVPSLALSAIPEGVVIRAPKPGRPTRRVYAVARAGIGPAERQLIEALQRSAGILADSRSLDGVAQGSDAPEAADRTAVATLDVTCPR